LEINYAASFPKLWFPNQSAIAFILQSKMANNRKSAFILPNIRTLKKHWTKKLFPYLRNSFRSGLFIAGGFVTSALISLTHQLLEMPFKWIPSYKGFFTH